MASLVNSSKYLKQKTENMNRLLTSKEILLLKKINGLKEKNSLNSLNNLEINNFSDVLIQLNKRKSYNPVKKNKQRT